MSDNSLQGSLAIARPVHYDDTWRWGFNINRASSTTYVPISI